jgi:hypothetical protein
LNSKIRTITKLLLSNIQCFWHFPNFISDCLLHAWNLPTKLMPQFSLFSLSLYIFIQFVLWINSSWMLGQDLVSLQPKAQVRSNVTFSIAHWYLAMPLSCIFQDTVYFTLTYSPFYDCLLVSSEL